MKWLYKLEYKYGKHYIERLMMVIIGGMGLVFVAQMMMPGVNLIGRGGLLLLTREGLMNWQLWRLFTFLFVPPSTGGTIFLFIALYFYYMIGNQLEMMWGGFRFNIYYLLGWLGAIISSLVFGAGDNSYLNASLFLAFATIAPDTTFMVFFILPVKAKWMAILFAAWAVFGVINAFVMGYGFSALGALLFSLLNYFVFFGRTMVDTVKNQIRIYKNRRNWRNR